MKLKSVGINIINGEVNSINFTDDDDIEHRGEFSFQDLLIEERNGVSEVFLVDSVYKYFRNYFSLNESEPLLEVGFFMFECFDFTGHVLFFNSSQHFSKQTTNIKFCIKDTLIIRTDGLASFFAYKENVEINQFIFMTSTQMKTIEIYTPCDLRIGGTLCLIENIVLHDSFLDNSNFLLISDVTNLSVGKNQKNHSNPDKHNRLIDLKIDSATVENLIFDVTSGYSYIVSASFVNSRILKGYFSDFIFNKFSCLNCEFKNIDFYNIKFPLDPDSFRIIRSKIKDCIFSNVNWGNFFSDKCINNAELKETYRMIKNEYEAVRNITEANNFYVKEMEFYRKSLWEQSPRPYRNIIVSLLNHKISDYGTNWFKALLIYIIFCSLVYIFYDFVLVHNGNISTFFHDSLLFWYNNTGNLLRLKWYSIQEFNDFSKFINPVPDLSHSKSILGIIFSIFKILIIYQIIAALRRISPK